MFELNRLHNMDCMEAMKEIPDKYFELAIVDPPYGIGESGESNKTRSCMAKSKEYKAFAGKDLEPPDGEYFVDLQRVSKNQIIWGANHFIAHIPQNSPCWIVWDKDNGLNDFADCELAWTSFESAVRQFTFKWHGMLQQNMKDKEIRIHPTQKPVALYKWLLTNYAKPGDKILDTHVGSASSLIACYDLGFDFLGFELDTDYFNAAQDRLQKHMAQGRLDLGAVMKPEQVRIEVGE